MILKSLHIISFGGLTNRDFDLSPGVNVFEGENESGKSSAAMFIKFIFYGLSSKSSKSTGMSEKKRYINTSTGQAAGYIMAETDAGKLYRLERAIITSDSSAPRERVRIIDHSTGEIITGQNPGEYFFGVSADVFVNTCFLSQAGDAKPEAGSFGQSAKGGVIGNMLTSADENTDIARAIDRLDAVRRTLLHKNKSGGEISALREKRKELEAELRECGEKAAEILTVSTSLEDITRRISELEESEEHYNGLFSALDKILTKRKLDSLIQTKSRIDSLSTSLGELDSSPLGEGFEEALNESERDIRAYDELCAAYDEMLEQYDEADDEALPDENEVIEEIHSAYSAARLTFSVSIALLLSGILGLGASFMLYFFNIDLYIIPLLVTAILLFLGVMFIIRHSKLKRNLTALLEQWGAESIDEIETAVSEKMLVLSRRHELSREKERMTAALTTAKLRFDTAEQRIESLAKTSNLPESGDIYETLSHLRRICEGITAERNQLREKVLHLRGKLEALEEQLDGIDPASCELDAYTVLETEIGQTADAMNSDEIKKAAGERDFTQGALKAALKRKSALEQRLAELGKLPRTPDETATLLSSVDAHIEELTLRHDACELAEKAIRAAGDNVQSGVIPKIASSASVILRGAAPHENILIDQTFSCSTASGDSVTSAEHLSRGTADLVYIALRIALSREIISGETPVLVMDESFSHIDTNRIKGLIRQLTDSQYLLFTCRSDEADIAEKLGCSVIRL